MRRVLVALAIALPLLAACRGETAPPSAGVDLLERWLRLGEEEYASVEVYDRALPPDLLALLNPGVDVSEQSEDLVTLPVHPDGELLGSFQIRRADGTHLLWVVLDIAADHSSATEVIRRQLDESPWQVVSEQSDRSLTVLGFQSTVSADVNGTAVAQPNPGGATYTLTVRRDGTDVRLTVPRGAPVPVIDAVVNRNLEVTRVNPGEAQRAGLRVGDVITRVGDTAVDSQAQLDAALAALAQGATPSTGLTYILQIRPPVTPAEPGFVLPPGRTLPDRFPSKDAWAGYTALDFAWFTSPQGSFYQASLLTRGGPSQVADEVRAALEQDGWLITSDRPVGFATVLEFRHDGDRLAGTLSVDTFPPDESLTLISVQIQTDTAN